MSSIVRTPPDAFTSKSSPTVCFIKETASGVAPPVEKPVDVLTNVAWASLANLHTVTIVTVCKLAKEAQATFVKTSTGFSTGGATPEAVSLMKQTVGDDLEVKASGGVRTIEDMEKVVAAGATRIGTSAGCKLVKNNNS